MLLLLIFAVNIASFLPPCDSLGDHTVELSGYEKWIPPGQVDNVLYCPQNCSLDDQKDRCCSCEAKRCWEINSTLCVDVIGQLHIEYSDIFGRATVIPEPDVNATLYELMHPSGRLAYMPENICSYGNTTVTINLARNRLSDISLFRCMTKLDTLILDYNPINSIDNTTFSNMGNLRKLSMSHCGITGMDPNAIAISHGNILSVDLSFNAIESPDVTNIFRNGSFCSISYEGNILKETSNTLNFTVKEGELLGPGTINLNYTKGGSFFNFTSIGILHYQDIYKYVSGRMYADESSIECDCNIYPLFNDLHESVFDLWGNFGANFICESPERMKGFDLAAIFDGNKTDELICDIQVNCPRFCQCIDTPSKGHVVVNCSRAGLAEMPSDMPFGLWSNYKINLLLEDNNIQRVENRNYLYRLVNLDLTGNRIELIDEEFAAKMNDELITEIDDQQLTTLPRRLQSRDPRNFKFGTHPILCTCENTWVGDWMRYYNARNLLRCIANDEKVDTAMINDQYLGCEPEEDTTAHPLVILSISAFVLSGIVLTFWAAYFFRFEVLLLKRKYFSKQKPNDDIMYDVFISLCDSNDDVFSWVRTSVIPSLQDHGYSVFCPWFQVHMALGRTPDRERLVANAVPKCRHHVVVLCHCYQSDRNSNSEFNLMWKDYRNDESKGMTVINFASLRKKELRDKRLKAFRRVREDLDFKTTKTKLLERLIARIGPPNFEPGRQSNKHEDKRSVRQEAFSCDAKGHRSVRNDITLATRLRRGQMWDEKSNDLDKQPVNVSFCKGRNIKHVNQAQSSTSNGKNMCPV